MLFLLTAYFSLVSSCKDTNNSPIGGQKIAANIAIIWLSISKKKNQGYQYETECLKSRPFGTQIGSAI